MDLKLSSDQIFIRDSAQAFANAEFAPQAALWDKECIFPVDSLKKAAALGYAGIYVSEDYGGSNLGRIEATLVFEALATACASTSAYMSIQNMVAWIIDQYGNANQKKEICYIRCLGAILYQQNTSTKKIQIQGYR